MNASDTLRKIKSYVESGPGIDVDGITNGYVIGGRYDTDIGVVRFEVGSGKDDGYGVLFQIVSGPGGERFEETGRSYMDEDGFSGGAAGLTKREYEGLRNAAQHVKETRSLPGSSVHLLIPSPNSKKFYNALSH